MSPCGLVYLLCCLQHKSLCDGMPRLFMQSVEMTLKNPEDNRHQLPGSGDQQAVAKDGFWV